MALSGVKTYTVSTQEIINDAFFKAGIHRVNASVPSEDYQYALRSFNEIVKSLQCSGLQVWNDRRAILFTQYGTASYIIGGTSGTNVTESYESTTLSVAAISGAGSITVSDATGISNGDFIGIVKDSGYIFWTTVNGVPVGNVITLGANLDGAAASGKTVFAYTTKITKPIEVTEVSLQQSTNNKVNLTRLPREKYFNLSDLSAIGSPNQYYYLRRRTDGVMYIWTTPSDVTQVINITYKPYLDNLVNQADEIDFPIEYAKPLKWMLASELCNPFGISTERSLKVEAKAQYWYELVRSDDNENDSLKFKVK